MKKQFTEEKPDDYTGLLLLRCERCGQVRAFYTKNPLVRYYCRDCGRTTPDSRLCQMREVRHQTQVPFQLQHAGAGFLHLC